MPAWILKYVWHGVSAGMVTLFTAAGAIATANQRLPLDWEWLVVVGGAIVALVNGVNSYNTDPK